MINQWLKFNDNKWNTIIPVIPDLRICTRNHDMRSSWCYVDQEVKQDPLNARMSDEMKSFSPTNLSNHCEIFSHHDSNKNTSCQCIRHQQLIITADIGNNNVSSVPRLYIRNRAYACHKILHSHRVIFNQAGVNILWSIWFKNKYQSFLACFKFSVAYFLHRNKI